MERKEGRGGEEGRNIMKEWGRKMQEEGDEW